MNPIYHFGSRADVNRFSAASLEALLIENGAESPRCLASVQFENIDIPSGVSRSAPLKWVGHRKLTNNEILQEIVQYP